MKTTRRVGRQRLVTLPKEVCDCLEISRNDYVELDVTKVAQQPKKKE